MNAIHMLKDAEAERDAIEEQMRRLAADRVAVEARVRHWRTMIRMDTAKPTEALKDAIVRVVRAVAREVTAADVVDLLLQDGWPPQNKASVSMMLGQLAKPGRPLRVVRRGVYVAA